MVDVAITGAAGDIGAQVVRAFAGHDVTGVDIEPMSYDVDGLTSVELDITSEPNRLYDVFAGHDVVVHLAARPNAPNDAWEDALQTNIDGTKQVYDVALDADVDRVVFASTNHTVQMYNMDDPEYPGRMTLDAARSVNPDDPTRPDSFYGISKVTGEAIGSYYADRYGIEVVNFRIGWLLTRAELREKQKLPPARAKYARAMWLSPRDCRNAFANAVTASLPDRQVTINVTSRNTERYLSQTEALRAIGYEPQDDSAEVVGSE